MRAIDQESTPTRTTEGTAQPLGITTSIVSHENDLQGSSTPNNDPQRGVAILRRFVLQSGARDLLPRERVSICLRYPHAQEVNVWHVPDTQTAHFGGLMICGSIWQCPACAAKVSERRRAELTEAITRWHAEPHNGNIILVTLTLRHHKNESLNALTESLREAWRQVKQGAGWKSFQSNFSVAGLITALEITHGRAGWHPHLHALFFVQPGLKLGKFTFALKKRWLMALERLGADATWEHGCDVRAARSDIADYVAKWGKEPQWTAAHELAKAASKLGKQNGRTPIELLNAYAMQGDQEAGQLWRIYAITMSGRNQLTWTRGLRALLGMTAEKTDEEVAKEREERAVKVASLTLHQWRVVLANDARGELLNVAATGDELAVQDFLTRLGVFSEAVQFQSPDNRRAVQMGLLDQADDAPMLSKRPAGPSVKQLSRGSYGTSESAAAAAS